jgi:hypothetical protein
METMCGGTLLKKRLRWPGKLVALLASVMPVARLSGEWCLMIPAKPDIIYVEFGEDGQCAGISGQSPGNVDSSLLRRMMLFQELFLPADRVEKQDMKGKI